MQFSRAPLKLYTHKLDKKERQSSNTVYRSPNNHTNNKMYAFIMMIWTFYSNRAYFRIEAEHGPNR